MTTPAVTVVTAVASLAALGVTYAVARTRVRYWRKWGTDLYDQLHDTIADRLDIDMTELTSP
jgi:hypothetical protein